MGYEGRLPEVFASVGDAFSANLSSGADVGASFAATLDGETIIDIWGGHLDEARQTLWREDTIVNVYSTTKTMAALCLLVLSDRGELDLSRRVSHYWPEFSAEGKRDVEVRHFLSHAAGLAGFEEPVEGSDLYDWEKMTTLLARQAPWWEPGTKSGYHAITQGYLLGEVVRRVTGQSLGVFLREEIAGALGTDFHIGLGAEHDERVGLLIPPEGEGTRDVSELGEFGARALSSPVIRAAQSHEKGWRRAEIPAANGHGNARSVAETLSLLANGGVRGEKRLISEAGAKRALEIQTEGVDAVLGIPVRWGLGFGLTSELAPLGPNEQVCFWGGYGGSLAVVDMDARVSFSYVMNKMVLNILDASRIGPMVAAFYEALPRFSR